MPYTPPYPSGWEDYPNTSTPLTAAALDAMDTGITNAVDLAEAAFPAILVANLQTASYTLALTDKFKMVEMDVATANNLTVPLNSSVAFPVGSQVTVLQVGAGQTTIVASGGVTVNATPGLKLRTQWSSATLIKRATDTWVAIGDLVA
jgi:hypothetical protein